jgi:MFS superfamily sulfate permease-like transporter
MRVAELRRYYRERRVEFWFALATLAAVITLDVLPALIIGVTAMLLLVTYHASQPHVAELGRVPDVPRAYGGRRAHPEYEPVPGLLILRLQTPVLYSNAAPVARRIKQLVGEADPTPRAVIVEAGGTDRIDITSAEMLAQLVGELHAAGIDLALADVHMPVVRMARRAGLLDELGEDRIFRTVDEAVEALTRAG